jgi:hypothetical protein
MEPKIKGKLIALLDFCYKEFRRYPRYSFADDSIKKVVGQWKKATSLEDVLIKVSSVNSLYNTQVFAVYDMAEHIWDRRIEDKILSGEVSAVEKIRTGHGIGKKRGYDRDFYSFATKYCHWHRPDAFPIYDEVVADVLWKLNGKGGEEFNFKDRFTKKSMRESYPVFVGIVNDLIQEAGADNWHYQKLDHALWILGKSTKKKLAGERADFKHTRSNVENKIRLLDLNLKFLS